MPEIPDGSSRAKVIRDPTDPLHIQIQVDHRGGPRENADEPVTVSPEGMSAFLNGFAQFVGEAVMEKLGKGEDAEFIKADVKLRIE